MTAHHARRRLKSLEPELRARPGRAWFPVLGRVGAATGGMVRVDVFPGACSDARFAAALARGATLAGETEHLEARLWPPQPELEGQSFELAVAMAAWSCLTEQPLPERLAFSGHFEGATLTAPAGLAEKRRTVDDAFGPQGRLLSGPTGALGVEFASSLPDLLRDVIGPLDHAVPVHRFVASADQHFARARWREAADFAARALDAGGDVLSPEELFRLATQRAHALAHLGDEGAGPVLARALADVSGADPSAQARARAVFAVATLDAGQPERALAVLAEGLPAAPTATARMELLGTQARCLSALGRHAEAIRSATDAVTCAPPGEKARCLVDRARWHLRAGDLPGAAADVAAAREAVGTARSVKPGDANRTDDFIRLLAAQIDFARGEHPGARVAVMPLIGHRDVTLRLGAAELLARLGGDPDPGLASLDDDLPPGIVTRLRARVELARPQPDVRRVEAWLGHPVPDAAALAAELTLALPY